MTVSLSDEGNHIDGVPNQNREKSTWSKQMNDNSKHSSGSENFGGGVPAVMLGLKARIVLACRLFRCALLHGMGPYMLGYRCSVCRPVRKRPRAVKEDTQS